jgi:hypothetical protein
MRNSENIECIMAKAALMIDLGVENFARMKHRTSSTWRCSAMILPHRYTQLVLRQFTGTRVED